MDIVRVSMQSFLPHSFEYIFNSSVQTLGVPGVLPERFREGMQIKHCALSLVGMYFMDFIITTFYGNFQWK